MKDNALFLTVRKIHSFGSEFHVLDESGKVVYYIRKKAFSYGKTFVVFDVDGTELGVIRWCFSLVVPKYRIQIGSFESYIVRRTFLGKYKISDLPWVFKNDMSGKNISVSDIGNHPLFNIRRISFSGMDKYNIILQDADHMLHSVLIAFAIDSMTKDLMF